MTTPIPLQPKPSQIHILITDDHALLRETWGIIFNADPRFKVLGTCGSGEEAIELSKSLQPDIIMMDINLPGISGFEATQTIRDAAPAAKVLGVSFHNEPVYARKMIQKGACGYITKNSDREELFEAITEVYKGNKYICREIKNTLSQQLISGEGNSKGLSSLSVREQEVIENVKKGYSSKEIGEAMGITAKTVEVHRHNMLKKLNFKSTAALVNFMNQKVN